MIRLASISTLLVLAMAIFCQSTRIYNFNPEINSEIEYSGCESGDETPGDENEQDDSEKSVPSRFQNLLHFINIKSVSIFIVQKPICLFSEKVAPPPKF